MKHFIVVMLILTSTKCFASCLIDDLSCSVAKIQQQQPMQRTYSQTSTIKEFAGSPEARLKPSQTDEPSKNLREFVANRLKCMETI